MANYLESGIGECGLRHCGEDHFDIGSRAAQAALSHLKKFKPCLAMVFISSKLNIQKAARGVKSILGDCPVIGSSAAGVIADSCDKDGVVVSVLASPHIRVKTGASELVGNDIKGCVSHAVSSAGIEKYFDCLAPQHQMLRMASNSIFGRSPVLLIVFSPGTTRKKMSSSHDIHSMLRKASANRIPIFGGSSSEDFNYGPNYQIIDDQVLTDAVVLAFLETDVLFGLGMSHGFVPTKKQVMVTSVSGHSVKEFDKRPALEVYAELLKMSPSQMQNRFRVGSMPFRQFPFGSLDMYGNSILHVPEKILEDGSILFVHSMENSRVLSLMRANKNDSLNAGVNAYEKAVLNGGLQKPSFIMMASCALMIKDQEEHNDLVRLKNSVSIPFCGLYTYGEKGALDDGLLVYNNQSVSTLVFSDELNPIASMVNNNKKIYDKFRSRIDKKTRQLQSVSRINAAIQNRYDVGRFLTAFTSEIPVIFPWAFGAVYLSEGNKDELALASSPDLKQFPQKISAGIEMDGFLYVGLDSHETSFGAMVLKFREAGMVPKKEDVHLAETIADMAVNGLHQIELDGYMDGKLQRFEMLNRIGHELSLAENENLPSEKILRHIKNCLDLSFVSLWLIDRPHKLLIKEAVCTREQYKIGELEKENDKRIAKWQIEKQEAIFYTNEPGIALPDRLIAPFNCSFVSLPIRLKGKLTGILNLFSERQYKWALQTEGIFEHIEFLQNISTQIAMYIENKSLHKHTTFFKEIHHRVKNNLQNIASLLRMQRRRLDTISADQALSDSIARIMSIAIVHDTLSLGEIGKVDLVQLMSGIIRYCESEAPFDVQIKLDVSGPLPMIPSKEATALSLVVNELVLNAVQHGLEEKRDGKLSIRVEHKKEICVEVMDDGPGLPDGFNIKKHGNLGLTIVQTLVKDELRGNFIIDGSSGTRAEIRFQMHKPYYSLQGFDIQGDENFQKINVNVHTDRKIAQTGGKKMTSVLKDKVVLAVDDEPDVLEIIEEELDMCLVHKAGDFDTAKQYLSSYTYDIVILDIMGVNGFELLKDSVKRGFPTTMLTANALTPESLKKSMQLGAVFFLPKEKLSELRAYLETVVLKKESSAWAHLFSKLGKYFDKRFGPDWKEKDRFFEEFVESVQKRGED